MEAAKRIYLIRVLEKMERNPKFNEKLGIKNKSQFNISEGVPRFKRAER